VGGGAWDEIVDGGGAIVVSREDGEASARAISASIESVIEPRGVDGGRGREVDEVG
jgi:hypothetical protein